MNSGAVVLQGEIASVFAAVRNLTDLDGMTRGMQWLHSGVSQLQAAGDAQALRALIRACRPIEARAQQITVIRMQAADALRSYGGQVAAMQDQARWLRGSLAEAHDRRIAISGVLENLPPFDDSDAERARMLNAQLENLDGDILRLERQLSDLDMDRRMADQRCLSAVEACTSALHGIANAVSAGAGSTAPSGGSDGNYDTTTRDRAYKIAATLPLSDPALFERLIAALERIEQGNAEDINEVVVSLNDADLRLLVAVGLATDPRAYWKMLSGLSSENMSRLRDVAPEWIQPDPGHRRKFWQRLDGRYGGAGDIEWRTPPGGLEDDQGWSTIHQGRYADCWLLAALAVTVRADPGWVSRNVLDNGNGTVTVYLRDLRTGARVPVTVTDELPFGDKGLNYGALGPNWSGYVEKAAAEFYNGDNDGYPLGGYAAIEWDQASQGIAMLSGKEAVPFSSSDFDAVLEAWERGDQVMISTPEGNSRPNGAPSGYVPGHVFVLEQIDDDGSMVLGNPHDLASLSKNMTLSPEQFTAFTIGGWTVQR